MLSVLKKFLGVEWTWRVEIFFENRIEQKKNYDAEIPPRGNSSNFVHPPTKSTCAVKCSIQTFLFTRLKESLHQQRRDSDNESAVRSESGLEKTKQIKMMKPFKRFSEDHNLRKQTRSR